VLGAEHLRASVRAEPRVERRIEGDDLAVIPARADQRGVPVRGLDLVVSAPSDFVDTKLCVIVTSASAMAYRLLGTQTGL